MIFAEIRGKLGGQYQRLHERSEDLLTSTVFGLLRYVPAAAGFLPILRRARFWRLDKNGRIIPGEPPDRWHSENDAATCSVDFWPSFGPYGEPDILMTFRDANGEEFRQTLVEVKLFSAKSGAAEEDDADADEVVPDPDQLVRYWHGWHQNISEPRDPVLVYLTAHGAPPMQELEDALNREPLMRLAWLSWADIWRWADEVESDAAWGAVARDITALLNHKGLRTFGGFRTLPIGLPVSGGFWRPHGLFFDYSKFGGIMTRAEDWRTISSHFWKGQR